MPVLLGGKWLLRETLPEAALADLEPGIRPHFKILHQQELATGPPANGFTFLILGFLVGKMERIIEACHRAIVRLK